MPVASGTFQGVRCQSLRWQAAPPVSHYGNRWGTWQDKCLTAVVDYLRGAGCGCPPQGKAST